MEQLQQQAPELAQEPVSQLQPEISQSQPEFGFAAWEAPSETIVTEEKPAEVPTTTAEEPALPSIEDLQKQIADLESRQPQREAFVPQELLDFYDTDDSADKISDIKAMTVYDYLVNDIKQKHPYATSEDDLAYWMSKEHPDLDPSIPENLGLPSPEYKALLARVEDSKQKQIQSIKEERKAAIEAIKEGAKPPAPAVVDAQAIQNEIISYVNDSLKVLDPKSLPVYEGLEVAPPSMEEVEKRAYERLALGQIGDNDPEPLPDTKGAYRELYLEKTLEVALSRIKELERKNPELVENALKQSLKNAPAEVPSALGDNRTTKPRDVPEFGFASGQY